MGAVSTARGYVFLFATLSGRAGDYLEGSIVVNSLLVLLSVGSASISFVSTFFFWRHCWLKDIRANRDERPYGKEPVFGFLTVLSGSIVGMLVAGILGDMEIIVPDELADTGMIVAHASGILAGCVGVVLARLSLPKSGIK